MGYFGIPFRNGVPIGLGSVASFGAQQFDPSSLFIGGTAGAWYDPSDLTTLFTTSAGTTPVAMPGQGSAVSVGLMLDKSKGLVLGSDVVINGDFSSSANWTLSSGGGGSATISGGLLTLSGGNTTFPSATQSSVLTSGRWYRITVVTTASVTLASVGIRIGGSTNNFPFVSAAGTYTATVLADGANIVFIRNSGYTDTAVIDSISVRELPGNHAIAFNDTTARPELSARVNQLLNTDGYSGATITPATGLVVVSTGLPDPQGGNTARQIRNTTTTEQHRLFTSVSFSGRPLYSVQVKNVDAGFIQLSIAGTVVAAFGATFDLTTKNVTLVSSGAMPTATIEDLNNGYLRCAVLAPATETGCANVQLYILEADASTVNPSTTGTNKSVIVAGADLRPANIGSAIPSYQRIADQYTYDSNGFPSYLRFDGVDDSMYTPANLNLSGTDKVAVFAGVRKLSDAASGILAETSANSGLNNGSFYFAAPDSANPRYGFALRGNTASNASLVTFAAPISNVVTALFDIDGATISDEMKGRVNGANVALSSTSGTAGTGNFGTYPLYIGARNNSSLWFNGHLYSLIIAGSAVSAGNISATESWVAGRTGIQI